MTATRITVLVENTADTPGLRGELGLSLWIERGAERVLLDTGRTPEILFGNATTLDVDLAGADAVVLSHGHHDHTGGIFELLRRAGRLRLFLHRKAQRTRFVRRNDGTAAQCGMPFPEHRRTLQDGFATTWTDRPKAVNGWLRVTGGIPRVTDFEDTGGAFYVDPECRVPDPLEDDQAAFFDTPDGTVVLLGCGHSGVINTLLYIRYLTGARPIRAVIGGMHLVNASKERLDRTVEELAELDPELIAACHCTGKGAEERLAAEFPDRWRQCRTGTRFEFA